MNRRSLSNLKNHHSHLRSLQTASFFYLYPPRILGHLLAPPLRLLDTVISTCQSESCTLCISAHVFSDSVKIILCPGYTVQSQNEKLLNQFGANAQLLGSKQSRPIWPFSAHSCLWMPPSLIILSIASLYVSRFCAGCATTVVSCATPSAAACSAPCLAAWVAYVPP